MSIFGKKDDDGGKISHITNQFMDGTVIHGDVKAANDIRIDGLIVGTVQATAKLVVGKTGRVDGDVRCASADIEGRVIGNLEVKEVLILKATAIVDGDITVNKLVVEMGARLNGNCTMGVKEQKYDRTSAALQKETV